MNTDLLIIGAGHFGLALAAQAQHDNIDHLIVAKAMEFWRANMPKGMFLRSACDWHLDPQNVPHTEIVSCLVNDGGEIEVTLTNGERLTVDKLILATGYKVDITRLPVLAAGNLLEQLETRNGFPGLMSTLKLLCRACSSRACPRCRTLGHSLDLQTLCERRRN